MVSSVSQELSVSVRSFAGADQPFAHAESDLELSIEYGCRIISHGRI
jgi:hypothetical protein